MPAATALRSICALILREIATSYGRTAGGYLWAVAEPVAAVALLTFVFSLTFNLPPLGQNFALFYASGYLPFMLYSDLAQKIGVSLRYSRPLLAYPSVTWLDALLARFILNALTQCVIIAVVIATILWMDGRPVMIHLDLLALSIALGMALGLGIGTFNTYLFEEFPVWERAWGILNRPLFVLSGVMFLPEAVPGQFAHWLWLNPLVHVIGAFRSGVYPAYSARIGSPGYVLAVSALAFVLGLLLLGKHARRILNEG